MSIKIGEIGMIVMVCAMNWIFWCGLAIWSLSDNFELWFVFLIFPIGITLVFTNLYYGWVTIE